MARLPIPAHDDGTWGDLLNAYLLVSHNGDGTLRPDVVNASVIQDGSIQAINLAAINSPTAGQVLSYNGSAFQWVAQSGGSTPDATSATKGLVRLTGDLSGTADAPTVPGLAGKVGTASNVNTAGVGVFKQKTGTDLEFKGINAASSKMVITDDLANNEIDIDVSEASLTHDNIGGTLSLAKGGTGATTQSGAANAILPAQFGNDTRFLTTDGSNAVWADIPFPTPRAQNAVFRFDGTLTVGDVSEEYHIWDAGTMARGPRLKIDNLSGNGTDTVVDVELDTGSGWVSMYSGAKPTIPAAQTFDFGPAPTTQSLPAGSDLRVKILAVPPGPSNNPSPATIPSQLGGNSGASAASNHTPAMPSGGQVGDIVVLAFSNQTPTVTMNASWTKQLEQVSNATTSQSRLNIFTAPWSVSLSTTVTQSFGSPAAWWVGIVRGGNVSLPVTQTASRTDGNAPGLNNGTTSTPSITALADADIVLSFASVRYNLTGDNWTLTPSGGPAGLSELADQVTTRGNTLNDVGIWVGLSNAVTTSDVLAATTLTTSGGTGDGTAFASTAAIMTLHRAPGTSGPTRLVVQVPIEDL